jgi:hypothetical protein
LYITISIRLPGHSFYWAALVISGTAPCEPVAVTLNKLGAVQYIPPTCVHYYVRVSRRPDYGGGGVDRRAFTWGANL